MTRELLIGLEKGKPHVYKSFGRQGSILATREQTAALVGLIGRYVAEHPEG